MGGIFAWIILFLQGVYSKNFDFSLTGLLEISTPDGLGVISCLLRTYCLGGPILSYIPSIHYIFHIMVLSWFYYQWYALPPNYGFVTCAEVLYVLSFFRYFIHKPHYFMDY